MILGDVLMPWPGLTDLHHSVLNEYFMYLFNDFGICAHLWTRIVLIVSSHLGWIFRMLILQVPGPVRTRFCLVYLSANVKPSTLWCHIALYVILMSQPRPCLPPFLSMRGTVLAFTLTYQTMSVHCEQDPRMAGHTIRVTHRCGLGLSVKSHLRGQAAG